MQQHALNTNRLDKLTATLKGLVGVVPGVGAIVAEAVGELIPNQRVDRIVTFINKLEALVAGQQERIDRIEAAIKTPEGLDIFEEGLRQSTRAVSDDRQKRLARLVKTALTSEQIKYEESRKLLNLFNELTDPEILWLIYFSKEQLIGSVFHRTLSEKHPDILKPVSKEVGQPQEEIDRGALQDSYKNTLERLGLLDIDTRGNVPSYCISPLGDLLFRYIESGKAEEDAL